MKELLQDRLKRHAATVALSPCDRVGFYGIGASLRVRVVQYALQDCSGFGMHDTDRYGKSVTLVKNLFRTGKDAGIFWTRHGGTLPHRQNCVSPACGAMTGSISVAV